MFSFCCLNVVFVGRSHCVCGCICVSACVCVHLPAVYSICIRTNQLCACRYRWHIHTTYQFVCVLTSDKWELTSSAQQWAGFKNAANCVCVTYVTSHTHVKLLPPPMRLCSCPYMFVYLSTEFHIKAWADLQQIWLRDKETDQRRDPLYFSMDPVTQVEQRFLFFFS